jgi:hypothetical protein
VAICAKIVDKVRNKVNIRPLEALFIKFRYFRTDILLTALKQTTRPFTASQKMPGIAVLPVLALVLAIASGCSGIKSEPGDLVKSQNDREQQAAGRVFSDGIPLLGGTSENNGPAGIGVNSFLWRASLDTISFMPLTSADPFGGVIITDWYSPPSSPLERFKMTVYILDRKLRADGLKVSVFRQTRITQTAGWNDAAVASTTPTELENAILTRARQLHVASVDQPK